MTAPKQATPFQTEAWTEYAIGTIILFLRIFARIKTVGFTNLQGDDVFTLVAVVFWTAELTMLELIGQNGTNIGLTDEQRFNATPEQVAKLAFGSKCLMAGWCCYVTLIWSLKTCMLFFYNRLTLGLTQQKLVKFNTVLCGCTYVAVMLTIILHCQPVQRHFQVYPDPGLNCTADYVNYIVIAITNVITDAILLSVPIPLLAKVRLALRRKLMIGVLLCGGLFVMVATLLRCILSLQSIDNINNSTIWAIRETFVAIIAVNAPCIKPLFSSSVWFRSSNKDTSSGLEAYGKTNTTSFPMSGLGRSKHVQLESTVVSMRRDSEELILKGSPNGNGLLGPVFADEHAAGGGEGGGGGGNAIQVTTAYEVRTDDAR
ncbi:hypothetical protein BJX61DRAFT_535664 [Aspergillus egyptiacus]|nr:hypothetical protein BJX61DRAFT_535664 [Aspergillus egyptiacus]